MIAPGPRHFVYLLEDRRPIVPHDPTLQDTIKNAIAERDILFLRLANSAHCAPADLAQLETANEELKKLLALTPGPNTPVLPPAVTALERLRCDVCTGFLKSARAENLMELAAA